MEMPDTLRVNIGIVFSSLHVLALYTVLRSLSLYSPAPFRIQYLNAIKTKQETHKQLTLCCACVSMYAAMCVLEFQITAKPKRKTKNWNITFIWTHVCVRAYVLFESFNTRICVRTYTNSFGRHNNAHGTRDEMNRTYVQCACVCVLLVIVIVAIFFTHSRAIHSNTKLLVQYLILHIRYTQYITSLPTPPHITSTSCSHSLCVLFYSLRLCSLPMSSIEQQLFRIWCVWCFSALFMFFCVIRCT